MKSISMTTWSVRAILAGRKTQTRRPANSSKPIAHAGEFLYVRETFKLDSFGRPIHRAAQRDGAAGPWTPSRFMPQRAARLYLELVEPPRRELVTAITPADAIAEGVELPSDMLTLWSLVGDRDAQVAAAALDSFRTLWDSIYAKQGNGWEARPPLTVWRYVFKPVTN